MKPCNPKQVNPGSFIWDNDVERWRKPIETMDEAMGQFSLTGSPSGGPEDDDNEPKVPLVVALVALIFILVTLCLCLSAIYYIIKL